MRKGDIYIGLIVLLIMGLLGLGYKLYLNSLGSERYLVIKVDGKIQKRIELTEETDIILTVLTEDGNFISMNEGEVTDTEYDYNVIHIYNSGFDVTEADCENQVDVKAPFVNTPGKSIICVPHRLEVVIVGGDSGPTIDA